MVNDEFSDGELQGKRRVSRGSPQEILKKDKKLELSIGLAPVAMSLSMTVAAAVDDAPKEPPVGLLRLTVKVSTPSRYESSIMKTEIVREVSPGANRIVLILIS